MTTATPTEAHKNHKKKLTMAKKGYKNSTHETIRPLFHQTMTTKSSTKKKTATIPCLDPLLVGVPRKTRLKKKKKRGKKNLIK